MKHLPFVAVEFRVLFPDEWVAGGGKKEIEILRLEGTQVDQIASWCWLKVEGQLKMSAMREW